MGKTWLRTRVWRQRRAGRWRGRLRNEELIAIPSETIRALGVAILQAWKDISCRPLLGAVDEERATERIARDARRACLLGLNHSL
jgi:hypothetical protein